MQPKQTPERGTLSQSHKQNANDLERLEEPGQGSWSYFSHSHLIFIACVLFMYVVLLIILNIHVFSSRSFSCILRVQVSSVETDYITQGIVVLKFYRMFGFLYAPDFLSQRPNSGGGHLAVGLVSDQ